MIASLEVNASTHELKCSFLVPIPARSPAPSPAASTRRTASKMGKPNAAGHIPSAAAHGWAGHMAVADKARLVAYRANVALVALRLLSRLHKPPPTPDLLP